jgi:hypothetical protein
VAAREKLRSKLPEVFGSYLLDGSATLRESLDEKPPAITDQIEVAMQPVGSGQRSRPVGT